MIVIYFAKLGSKKIAKRTTSDTYETYYDVVNTEDKMNILDSDFRLMLHDWYYSLVRLEDSDFALVYFSPPGCKWRRTKT